MRFKKSFVILVIFILFTTIFNFNSAANKIICQNSNNDIEETKEGFESYIIQFKDEPIIRFKDRLKSVVNYLFSNFSEKIKHNFITKRIQDYRRRLESIHTTIKETILKTIGFDKKLNGLVLREFYSLFNGISIKKISKDDIIKIKNLPHIKNVFPNYKIYATLDESVPLINADDVWKMNDNFGENITGKGITIAILDTGVDYNHLDLKSNYISEGSYDFVNNDNDPMDDNGHGTHVTGIALGKGNESNYRYIGVAPDAKFYSFKILKNDGEGDFLTYYDGMMRALDPNNDGDMSDHVDIVSLSFGTKKPGNPDDSLCQVLDNVVSSGIIVVAAAGNLGPEPNTISSPGCARKSICVGSTNKNDVIAYSSSRGPVIWNNSYMEKPDVVAPGVSITSTRNGGGYEFNSGTSMATPHVSGATALILQANPEFNIDEIKQVLIQSAIDIGENVNTQGGGRIDVLNALTDENQLIINSPEEVYEAQIFRVRITNNKGKPIRAFTMVFIPFHIPRFKYGHSRRFIAPLVFLKNRDFIEGKIIVFKLLGGLKIVKKDIRIVNWFRVK
jgi:hypothetical protein